MTSIKYFGKEVDDFHTVDKQKIFASSFSATQEIDRIQQEEKAKLNNLTTKVKKQESEITYLKLQIEELKKLITESK